MHIKEELEYFRAHQIRVKVLDIPTTLVELPKEQAWIFEMINNILIEVLASIAEQERLTTRRRQSEGIAVARKAGKHLGVRTRTFLQTGMKFTIAGEPASSRPSLP